MMGNSDLKLLLLAAIAILIAILLIVIYKRYFSNQTDKVLKKISFDILKNVTVEVDVDNNAYFDYVLLMTDRIVVVMHKNYAGNIYGSTDINEWTQIIGTRSYKFNNPAIELSRDIELLKSFLPQVPVDGILLFGKDSKFPTSKPDCVMTLDEIREKYQPVKKNKLPDNMSKIWETLSDKLSI